MSRAQPGDPAALALDVRVRVELTLEEASSLLAWLLHVNDDGLNPPVARELARVLEQALEAEPMA